jgi:hypothetical protein
MADSSFLALVHQIARRAADARECLSVYRVADALRATGRGLHMTRRMAADHVIAAALIYGAPMLIDPNDTFRPDMDAAAIVMIEDLRQA